MTTEPRTIHPRPNRRRPWVCVTVKVPVGVLDRVKEVINDWKAIARGVPKI